MANLKKDILGVVKIEAFSPEFSTLEETENSDQSHSSAEASLPPVETQATSGGRQERLFDWGPGEEKFHKMKAESAKGFVRLKKIKENQSFDTCEHKLELLESSLNWREIRKTLHWLDRMLASNQTNMELCRRRKGQQLQPSFNSKINQFEFQSKFKNKKSTDPMLSWMRRNSKLRTYSKRNKKLRKIRKHGHKSWKTQRREEWNKKKKLKKKEHRFRKYFHKKHPATISPNNILSFNTTILNPNSDVEKIFIQRTKNKGGNNFKNRKFGNSVKKMCVGVKCAKKKDEEPQKETKNQTAGSWLEETKSRERGQDTKTPKRKPWPHFVYHRVSSNFLHPDSANLNHRQSAYIAISVVTSSKPDSTDNNDVI